MPMDNRTDTEKLQAAIADITKVRDTRGVAVEGGKKYTMVQDRVEAVRRHLGVDISIETEVLETSIDLPIGLAVIVRASVLGNGGAILATGHACEVWGSSPVNTTSALEACETSAVGRALAALGIHGGEFASANELDAVVRKGGTVNVSPVTAAVSGYADPTILVSSTTTHDTFAGKTDPLPSDGAGWQEITVKTELKIPDTPEEWLAAIDKIKVVVSESAWPNSRHSGRAMCHSSRP